MIRLLYTLKDGFEGVADRETFEEARALVNDAMTDWTIFELVKPGRYAVAGKVLADIKNPERKVIEGYEVTGKRYPRSRHSFVMRSTMRGRPWLLFLAKLDEPGRYWVTAHPTLKAAMAA